MNKQTQDFRTLQRKLKELRDKGLYRGDLNLKKSELQKALDKITDPLRTLEDKQKTLFQNKADVFKSKKDVDRSATLDAQKELIKKLKQQYQDIVKKTGLTGTSNTLFFDLSADQTRLFKKAKPTNSVKRNNEIIKDLRLAILPLLSKFNRIKDNTNFNLGDIKDVRQRLKNLKKEGKIKVDLRQSNQKLKQILSNYILANSAPAEQQTGEPNFEDITVNVNTSQSSFKGLLRDITITTNPHMENLRAFFTKIQDQLLDILQQQAQISGFKMYYILYAQIYRKSDPFNTLKTKPLQTTKEQKAVPIPHKASADYIHNIMTDLASIIEFLLENLNEQGSDWALDHIIKLKVKMAKWNPLKGGTYIELPQCLNHSSKGLINIKNNDPYCFLYNNVCYFHKPKKNRDRVSHYKKYVDEFRTDGIQFPMTLDQIPKWDKLNNTRTFVFSPKISSNGKLIDIEPIHINKENTDCPNEVCHLLLEDTSTGNKHFVYIDNISALCPYTKKSQHKQFLCYNCMNWFRSEEKLTEHKNNSSCLKNDCCKVRMPEEGTKLTFSEFQKMNRLPFMVVFDIESDLVACENSKERFVNQHVPNSLCAHFYSDFGDNETQVFYGSECVIDFLAWLTDKEDYIKNKMIQYEEMILTDEDERSFQNAKNCYLCKQPFPKGYNTDKALYKVRDHDHFTGAYRGACHSSCNLNYNNRHFCVPVVAHNLQGYDSNLILRDVCQLSTERRKFECIPMNTEKFISFSLGKFRFIDSYSFMSSSLDSLVENLKQTEKETNVKQFNHLESYYGHLGYEKLEMLKQKGVYPYSYANGKNSFDIPHLPEKKWFFNDLTDTPISDEDYQRAQKVFDLFECKTFQDYHDLYLITDVLLLSDVWEAFRSQGLRNNELDPAHFYGVPGFTFTSWKKQMMEEGQEPIELLSDYDMFTFFERSKRGGLSQISHRYAKANNEYCPWFDSSKPKSHLLYVDMNSLYPTAMSKYPLPHSQFQWRHDYTLDDILKLDPFGETGCLVECDIDYPDELHDSHNDYPCALENKPGNFSPLMQQIANKLDYKLPKNEKLIANLEDKRNYVCDYRCLHLYHSLGLKVTKIHKVVEFKQTYSMKSYVDKMMNCRKNAKNSFEKDYFKLLMNALYGKTVENERNYSSLELCTDYDRAKKKINSFRCKSWTDHNENTLKNRYFSDSFLMVDMTKTQQTFKKPIFLGTTILELSKHEMIDFHYNTIRHRYGDNARLLFTDTDSFMYHIQTDDVYSDMIEDREYYDFSAYDKKSYIYSQQVPGNTKAFGKFKDEQALDPIIEFAGRAPKEYSYRTASDAKKIKGKGTPSHVLDNQCSHADAVDMILSAKDESKHSKDNFNRKVTFKHFRTIDHVIYTEESEKTGMSILDSKRYVCEDGVSTLAWGNKDIPRV